MDLPRFLLGNHPGLILKTLHVSRRLDLGTDTQHCVLSRSGSCMLIIFVVLTIRYSLQGIWQDTNQDQRSALAAIGVSLDSWE